MYDIGVMCIGGSGRGEGKEPGEVVECSWMLGCVFAALGYDGAAVSSVGRQSSTGRRVHPMVAVFPVRSGL